MKNSKLHLRLVESSEDFFQRVWQRDGMLVVTTDSVFHDRCVVCNKEAGGRSMSKMLFWHTPLILPLLILSFPFYLIFAIIFRRTMTVTFPLCMKHWLQRRILSAIGVLLLPSFFVMGWYAIISGTPIMVLTGLLSSIVGVAILGYARNPIWAQQIQNDHAVVRGAHPDFVDNFPVWTENSLK